MVVLATMRSDFLNAFQSFPSAAGRYKEVPLDNAPIALRGGDAASAVRHFRAAADLEDGMLYEEPPLWYYPVRHSLGRALLEAGRPEEAEVAYRQDLARFPANGWSLFGLAESLEAQGKDAAEARAAFERAWADADVTLTASRF